MSFPARFDAVLLGSSEGQEALTLTGLLIFFPNAIHLCIVAKSLSPWGGKDLGLPGHPLADLTPEQQF